jgi:urease accessory protein
MERDATRMRGALPFVFTDMKNAEGVDEVVSFLKLHGGL